MPAERGGFFRVEADGMHQLVAGLGQCEDDLGGVTAAMRDSAGEGSGCAEIDTAIRELADRMGDKGTELGEHVTGMLGGLRTSLEVYESVDQAWAQNWNRAGGESGPSPQPSRIRRSATRLMVGRHDRAERRPTG